MNQHYYDASEVKVSVCQKLKEIVKDIYPSAKIRGAEARIGSIDGEPGSSMSISLDPGKFGAFFDHASNEKGDLIGILEATKGLKYGEAIEWLGSNYTSCSKRPYEPDNPKENTPQFALDFCELNEAAVTNIQDSRHISPATLQAYKVKSWVNDPNVVCFLSANKSKQVSKIEYCDLSQKKFWSSPHPKHNLFGKNICDPQSLKGILVITEGRWDAMSYYEANIPAVSIPSGVCNNYWIDADWEYLQQFHTILLSYDMDEAGQDAIHEVVNRLGAHKCQIIELPEKDANATLIKFGPEALTECVNNAKVPESPTLISSIDLKEATYELMLNGASNHGDPYFLPDFDIRIRPHEMTLVFGMSFHGKSQFISNQIAFDAHFQIQSAIASFEQITVQTMRCLVEQYSNNKYIATDRNAFDKCYDSLAPFVTIYDTYERTKPSKIIDDFIYAHKRKGINRFYVDNVMSLDSSRDDNAAQANTAHMFREFTKKYPVHLFVVAHPRKPSHDAAEQPPKHSDIRGAGEWGDIPENIITVWRNIKKSEDIEEMILDGRADHDIRNFDRSIPDGKILVRKQRITGTTPIKNFWFNNDTKRFWIEPGIVPPFKEETEEDPF